MGEEQTTGATNTYGDAALPGDKDGLTDGLRLSYDGLDGEYVGDVGDAAGLVGE